MALLSSELGYSTCTPYNTVNCSDAGAPGDLTELGQAEYLARRCLVDTLAGVKLSIWYLLMNLSVRILISGSGPGNDTLITCRYEWTTGLEFPGADPFYECALTGGSDPTNREQQFGVVRCERDEGGGRPARPAYQAAVTLQRMLGDCDFTRRVDMGDEASLFALEFRCGDGAKAVAAWTTETGNDTAKVNLNGADWRRYSMIGGGKDGQEVTVANGQAELRLTTAPVYLRSRAL